MIRLHNADLLTRFGVENYLKYDWCLMLDRMRTWGRSTAVKVLFLILMIAFAFWGVGTGLAMRVRPVATVNGNRILANDLDREADQIKRTLTQIYGANAQQVLHNVNLRQEALNQIIEQRLIAEEARHVGIRVSDQSLADKIAADPNFQEQGIFDPKRYEDLLQENGLLPTDYENSVRTSLMREALRQMVDQGVQVSDAEVHHAYDLRNQKVKLAYFMVPYQDFTAKISPTPKQIEDYYKSHQEEFRQPERIKIAYIHYDPAILAAKVSPPDKDIEDYYKSNLKKLYTHPDEVHARHILIEVASGATAEEKAKAKAKAEDVMKQLQKGADFAKLAKQYSQDPSTRMDGGDLGTFGRNQMIKPFEDAAFSMKPGELRLVETKFGFHDVKLDSISPAHVDKLTDVRPKIIEALRAEAGGRMSRQALDEDVTAALANGNLADLAKKRGLELVETPAFSRDDAASVVHEPKLIDTAFKLDVGQVRAVSGGTAAAPYLVKTVTREPEHVPPMKDIEAKVRDAYIRATAESQALAKAQDLLKQIKTPDDFDKIAQANKLAVHRTDSFLRSGESVPELGSFPEVSAAAGVVPRIPGVIDRVMQNKGDAYLFEVTERTAPSDEDWKSAEKDFTSEFVQQRRAEAWTHFIETLKSRARISVDSTQFAQGGPASAPLDD
jgi:peptidyl-prolyl cis-trans isomerase D